MPDPRAPPNRGTCEYPQHGAQHASSPSDRRRCRYDRRGARRTFSVRECRPSEAAFQPLDTPTAATVTLPTGDQVQWSTDATGRQAALVVPGGSSGASLTLRLAGDLFVIPQAALPSLADGAGLNAFDATALAQHRPPAAPATGLEGTSGRFPMRTLRITGIDELGQPAIGLAMFYLVVNAHNGNRFAFFGGMATGIRNMAVPVARRGRWAGL